MKISLILQISLVMLLWAICFPLITVGIEHSPHLTFATVRAILSGLILVGLALASGQSFPNSWRLWKMIAVIGLGATTFGFLGMFHAAEFVSPGVATVIANTQPLMATVLAGLVLQERLTIQRLIGLLLGFGGIIFIAMPAYLSGDNESYAIGISYIILAALGISISNVWIKRIAGDVDALMAMGLQLLIGSIPLGLIAWTREDPTAVKWSIEFVGSLGTLSVFGTALAYWLWFSILEKTSLNRANAFSFFVPVFGLAMGVILFDEIISSFQWAGIALTVVGVGLAFRKQKAKNLSK